MNDVIKTFEELTARDIALYCWVELQHEGKPRFVRGRKRTMDEGIILCNGDIKRYLNYVNDYEKMTQK